jgi:hypothetical protein
MGAARFSISSATFSSLLCSQTARDLFLFVGQVIGGLAARKDLF